MMADSFKDHCQTHNLSYDVFAPENLTSGSLYYVRIWSAPGLKPAGATDFNSLFAFGVEQEETHLFIPLVPFKTDAQAANGEGYYLPDCNEFVREIGGYENPPIPDRTQQEGACPP